MGQVFSCSFVGWRPLAGCDWTLTSFFEQEDRKTSTCTTNYKILDVSLPFYDFVLGVRSANVVPTGSFPLQLLPVPLESGLNV
jgi:hypothetical protein